MIIKQEIFFGLESSIFKNIIKKKVTEKQIGKMNFIDKNVSVEQAIIILAKTGIQVNEKEAKIILELLYLVSKITISQKRKNAGTLMRLQTTLQYR
ncbi:hypothetical protein MP478_01920 [Chryseobacterium sp. WG14]|uniref:hypothetical protein n=1 Tax=Chryseobacterium sp. WG14 TaxID=2926909 RepID=UPI00211E6D9A|nr:hypothetical protein [Chryseobacterium sp. WG14]MCQ9638130.1 hypothetical protein [Chryseobacterium sp. WG14]